MTTHEKLEKNIFNHDDMFGTIFSKVIGGGKMQN
jgi:hypothetical protein